MRGDLKVRQEDAGFWFKPGNGSARSWHFVENDAPMKRCCCGGYVHRPDQDVASAARPEGWLNKECQRVAEKRVKQLETRKVEALRAELRALGGEVMEIIGDGVRSAVLLCDPVLIRQFMEAYHMVADARLVEYLRHLGLYDHVNRLIMIGAGEANDLNEEEIAAFKETDERLLKVLAEAVKDKDQ